jgi:hypothetical protein
MTDITLDDARAVILRRLTAGETLTKDSLLKEVDSESGEGAMLTFARAVASLIADGEVHSVRGRSGGLRLGPQPPVSQAARIAAAIAAANREFLARTEG